MKGKKIMATVLATAMLAGALGGLSMGAAAADESPADIPLRAVYTNPAETWESDATPLGNGFIGGMVFGGVDSDRIQINEHTLWSGGPGANPNFDGGANGTAASAHQALQDVREALQTEMTNFTKNNSARLQNGRVVSSNYANSSQISTLMNKLKGEKAQFGSYQTLGNLVLSDPIFATAAWREATSTEEPTDSSGEAATNLFDGSTSTKWFAGNSGHAAKYPVEITWSYTGPNKFDTYKISSANDEESRDPSEWILYGSADGKDYVELDRQVKVTFAGRFTTNVYKLKEEQTYQYFKLSILKTKGSNPPQISEIELSNSKAKAGTKYTDYTRTLDLDKGMATVSYKVGEVTYTREYFISNPGNIMVIRLSADKANSVNRLISITSEQSKKTISIKGDTITMVGQPSDHKKDGLYFAQMVKVIPDGGTLTATEAGVDVEGANSVLVIMSCGTNYQQCMDTTYDYFSDGDPMVPVEERVAAASKKTYDELFAAHEADYTGLFGRVKLNLGYTAMPKKTTEQLLMFIDRNTAEENRYLETLYYQFGRYLLIGSSREGSLPANLQGIWAEGMAPPWSADYHTNITVQMNYWLAEQTNLTECHTAVIDYINANVARGTETAKMYHCKQDGGEVRGWTMYHENNIWGNTMPAVSDAFYCPAGGAWMCQDIWEYYAFTMDKEFLSKNFDTLLSAAIFWVDNLWTDSRDGTLVSSPSYSPEHGSYSLGCSFDQEVIWELFTDTIKAAEVLGINDDARLSQVNEIKAALEKLYMPKVGLSGKFLEWKDETTIDINGDGQHRHVNHLFALHPGSYVVAGRSDWDDEMVEAMKKVLITRGDGGTGWSKAWKINFWARLRDGDHAATMVKQILKESTLDNLFDTHSPFQIDGNFGATAGMTEMLLQSQGDSIDLYAAMPNSWGKGGTVRGLRARGDFTVDMTWADQQLNYAAVTSGSGADCTLNYHSIAKATVKTAAGAPVETTVVDKDTITFATKAGETYVVTEIPQDKKFSESVNLLRTNFNNLYTDALVKAAGTPDDNGARVESFDVQPAGPKVGLEVGDVVIGFNGEAINTTADLKAKYEAVGAYEPITLTIFRSGRTFDSTFTKMELAAKNDDLYHVMPGRIWAGGYKALYDGAVSTRVDDALAVKGPGSMLYYNLYLHETPIAAKMSAVVKGTGKVTVYLDTDSGDEVAVFDLTDTNGAPKTFSGRLLNREYFEGYHDFHLVMEGDVTVCWFEFSNDGLLGDVDSDGKITTTDARLTLQYAAKKIGEDALNTGVADVDGDGKYSTTDARLILQKAAKKIDQFPAEA